MEVHMNQSHTDCRSPTGVTVGLIDGLIAISRVLAQRDLTAPEVQEALTDLRYDEDVWKILTAVKGQVLIDQISTAADALVERYLRNDPVAQEALWDMRLNKNLRTLLGDAK